MPAALCLAGQFLAPKTPLLHAMSCDCHRGRQLRQALKCTRVEAGQRIDAIQAMDRPRQSPWPRHAGRKAAEISH
jgi:hypothetical protein